MQNLTSPNKRHTIVCKSCVIRYKFLKNIRHVMSIGSVAFFVKAQAFVWFKDGFVFFFYCLPLLYTHTD